MRPPKTNQNPDHYIQGLIKASTRFGFQVSEYGRIENYPLLALERCGDPNKASVYLSGGIHGDEPASTAALLELIESDRLPKDLNYTICPLINPIGLAAGTRENGDGVDLNRDFRSPTCYESSAIIDYLDTLDPFHLSICVHEDWEAKGFYLYFLGGADAVELAESAITAAAKSGPIDHSELIDEREAANGIIHPPSRWDPYERKRWPEAFFLVSRKMHPHFTFETASTHPIEERIAQHVAAIESAVLCLSEKLQ